MKVLDEELTGAEIGSWVKPLGGYFISFDAMEGCAKKIVAKCKEAGVTLTNAGCHIPIWQRSERQQYPYRPIVPYSGGNGRCY